jgi:hypothetical protein
MHHTITMLNQKGAPIGIEGKEVIQCETYVKLTPKELWKG